MRNLNNGPPGSASIFHFLSNALTTGGGDGDESHAASNNGGGSHGRRRSGRVSDQTSV